MATVRFKGASGSTYDFTVYPINSSFQNYGAVYVFTKEYNDSQGTTRYRPLYIGRTSELGDRIDGHEKRSCVDQYGANTLCVYWESSATQRSQIETDLLNNYTTPCNETN